MSTLFESGTPLMEGIRASIIIVVFLVAAGLTGLVIRFVARRKSRGSKTPTGIVILIDLLRPLAFLIVTEGIILALYSVSYWAGWHPLLKTIAVALAIVLVTYGAARVGRPLLGWYLRRTKVRQSLSRLLQRVTVLIVYAVGLLILLDYLEISISPLLAGLGIGGLAIALALQPSLSNFFAGAQIVSDKIIQVGDYVEIESGATGNVVSIGWRSTRLRTTHNNMLIIPNSKLVDSIVTNFHGPAMELAVIVESGVSYSSDLVFVEQVALEVAREVIQDLPEAVKNREPWFGFDTFGDSNINFWVWLYATDRLGAFRVRSEVIKRLHVRFAAEGIVINYPVRLLTYENPE